MRKLLLYLVSGIKSKNVFRFVARYFYSPVFLLKYYKHREKQKIIYVLTPLAQLSNIGDHAQASSIHNWLDRHFNGKVVIELDKDMTYYLKSALKKITNEEDIIFIHSGGNMGDISLWSEEARRLIIEAFPDNKIISLPQTIHFSNTAVGRKELSKSSSVYNGHKDLTIYGRDMQSTEFASSTFFNAKIHAAPDFVLRYPYESNIECTDKVLLCLRHDSESIFQGRHEKIQQLVKSPTEFFDTTLPFLICKNMRNSVLNETLDYFKKFKFIITDRYHGLIFSVLVKRPCIVLPTYNHKLTSALKDWFDDINFIFFAPTEDEIPEAISKASQEIEFSSVDWDEKYFDQIAKRIVNDL
ncbi:MAG: polysaccharide pyruvyl transferase [Marinilabiliales bacterium]|nr:MAG: polysaccharide pyruvyl transferase [Marinilabiliales bacterium]